MYDDTRARVALKLYPIAAAAIASLAWTATAHADNVHEFMGASQNVNVTGDTIKFFSTEFSIPADPLHDGQDVAIWAGLHSGEGFLLQGGAHFGPGTNLECKGNANAWTIFTELAYDSGSGGGCGADAVAHEGDRIVVAVELAAVRLELVGNPGAKQYRYVEHWDVRVIDVTQNYATSVATGPLVVRGSGYQPMNQAKAAEEWINPNGNQNPIPCMDSVNAAFDSFNIAMTPYSTNSNQWINVPWAPAGLPVQPPDRTIPDACGYLVDVNGIGGPNSLTLTVF